MKPRMNPPADPNSANGATADPSPSRYQWALILDYQGFFGLTSLDKPSWTRLSYTLSPRFARENPDDFYPATAVHQ